MLTSPLPFATRVRMHEPVVRSWPTLALIDQNDHRFTACDGQETVRRPCEGAVRGSGNLRESGWITARAPDRRAPLTGAVSGAIALAREGRRILAPIRSYPSGRRIRRARTERRYPAPARASRTPRDRPGRNAPRKRFQTSARRPRQSIPPAG